MKKAKQMALENHQFENQEKVVIMEKDKRRTITLLIKIKLLRVFMKLLAAKVI